MILETHDLCKAFGDKEAVKKLCIHIEEGEIYAFLGLNGAGKTTTVRMLCGLIRPTSGTATVAGRDLVKDTDYVKSISSISPQESALSGKMTVYENIYLMARVHAMRAARAAQKTNELIDTFHLAEVRSTRAEKLSGGYQRRLSIAMALVSDPQILYLDEPTLGLDVIARRELWKTILSLKKRMSVILTTHYLEEVEALSDHIGIIKDGTLLFEGDVPTLLRVSGKSNIEDAFVAVSGGETL